MSTKNAVLKIFFGGIIFLFALALAYATANYLGHAPNGYAYGVYQGSQADVYWYTLMIAGGLYVAVGIAVSTVFPVSLGFLFSADVLILYVLGSRYGTIPSFAKLALVGVVLLILYAFAWKKLGDEPEQQPLSPPTITST